MAFDVIIAALIAVLSIIDVASKSATSVPWERNADALAYMLVVIGSLSLAWRRRRPTVVLGVVVALVAVFWLRGHGALLSVLGLPALYAVAAHEQHRRRAWVALISACAVLLLAASASVLRPPSGFDYFTLLSMAAFLAGAIVFGLVVRHRERIFVDSERRAAEAEANRLVEARRAVLRERRRIAREMHDVVAHSMSVITVQAAAGAQIVHADADKAADVFAQIEAVGRESLTELRRMLGVLRDDANALDAWGLDAEPGAAAGGGGGAGGAGGVTGGGVTGAGGGGSGGGLGSELGFGSGSGGSAGSRSPQPRIADIVALVERSVASDPSVLLIMDGPQRPLGAGIELAAFRIVQEALTNVRKHAGPGAHATVHITYETVSLVLEVIDDGRGALSSMAGRESGHGLVGMRERVEIYGGTLSVGPRAGGGFAVRAVLPVAELREGSL